MPNSNEQMETRVMKVTMKKEAFDLFDKGELHSDSGIRDSQGKIRVHPDIEPYVENDISQDDKVLLPQKSSTSVGQQVGSALAEVVGEIIVYVITNPDVHRAVAKGVKSFWKTKVKPVFHALKGNRSERLTASKIIEDHHKKMQASENDQEKYVVSGEQAVLIVEAMKQKARELSAMIYLLSNLYVKDEKTDEEYLIEQSYIKQLVSEESRSTMEVLVENGQVLDKETVICFTEFLNGYIRNGNKRIPFSATNIQ